MVGGCVDVLMVQPAEKIRLSKWDELPLLPASALHFFVFLHLLCLYFCSFLTLLAPTGALIVIVCYYWSVARQLFQILSISANIAIINDVL